MKKSFIQLNMKTIAKEKINELNFPSTDVLSNTKERKLRFATAQKARTLGNIEKSKAKIDFHTTEGPRRVNTTVWHVDQDFIMLKGASALPMRSVYSISL